MAEEGAAEQIAQRNTAEGKPVPPPGDVKARMERASRRLHELSGRRKVCVEFANGNHYIELGDDGIKTTKVSTTAQTHGGDAPNHRVRRSHDVIAPVLKRKVSTATQRPPDYEAVASSGDHEDYAGARWAEKVSLACYERWDLKRIDRAGLWNAMVTEEAFAMPVWDTSVGPYYDVSRHPEADAEDGEGNKPYADKPDPENPKYVGKGEVKVKVWSGLEVSWEPGVEFEDSPYYVIVTARPVDQVELEQGYIKGPRGAEKLKADAASATGTGTTTKQAKGSNLVLVTEYLERPCPKYPNGRHLVYANDRQIFKPQPYPKRNEKGEVLDEPCLHKLVYDIDGTSERGKGLVWSLIDPVRALDQAINKQHEYAQFGLVPQLMAAEGVVLTDITDEPGLLIEFDVTAANNERPEFRDNIDFPQELFQMEERAKALISEISFDQQVPKQVESGKGINAIVEKDAIAWQDFIDDFDRWRGRIMRDCLVLVQHHYDDERLLQIRGRTGGETLSDFRGSKLNNQVDVRVKPGSTEAFTRPELEQRILNLVRLFPGFFAPEVVIAALNSAQPERLIEGYEEDVARAHRIIGQIRTGEFWRQPERPVLPGEAAPELDPQTMEPVIGPDGEPVMLETVPGWLPRPFDNIPVEKAEFEAWMKTDEWDGLDDEAKQASMFYYQALEDIETRNAQRTAELQSQMAEQLGMENAGKPQGPKPMPSQPSLGPGEAAPPAPAGAPQ